MYSMNHIRSTGFVQILKNHESPSISVSKNNLRPQISLNLQNTIEVLEKSLNFNFSVGFILFDLEL